MSNRLDALLSPVAYRRLREEALKRGCTQSQCAAQIIRDYCANPSNFIAVVPFVSEPSRISLSLNVSLECRRILEQSSHLHLRNKGAKVAPQVVLARAIELHYHTQDLRAAAEAALRKPKYFLPALPDKVWMPRKASPKFRL